MATKISEHAQKLQDPKFNSQFLTQYLHNNFLKIIVKTNSNKTEITGFDEARKAVKMNVSSLPIEGKANIEIIKFFKKTYKLNVEIKTGKTSKEKLLKII